MFPIVTHMDGKLVNQDLMKAPVTLARVAQEYSIGSQSGRTS